MANTIGFNLSGDKALMAKLQGLRKGGARRVLARTVMRGGRALAKAAKAAAPVDSGDLKNSIRAKLVKGRGVMVRVAPRYAQAPHAHLVEFGTLRLRPATKGGGARVAMINGNPALIHDTGIMPANPFLRRTFDFHGPMVLDGIMADTRKEIEKEAAKG